MGDKKKRKIRVGIHKAGVGDPTGFIRFSLTDISSPVDNSPIDDFHLRSKIKDSNGDELLDFIWNPGNSVSQSQAVTYAFSAQVDSIPSQLSLEFKFYTDNDDDFDLDSSCNYGFSVDGSYFTNAITYRDQSNLPGAIDFVSLPTVFLHNMGEAQNTDDGDSTDTFLFDDSGAASSHHIADSLYTKFEWKFETGATASRLKNIHTGTYLQDSGGNVILGSSLSTNFDKWTLVSVGPTNRYYVKNVGSATYLACDVDNGALSLSNSLDNATTWYIFPLVTSTDCLEDDVLVVKVNFFAKIWKKLFLWFKKLFSIND